MLRCLKEVKESQKLFHSEFQQVVAMYSQGMELRDSAGCLTDELLLLTNDKK